MLLYLKSNFTDMDKNLENELKILKENIIKIQEKERYDLSSSENLFQSVPVLPKFLNNILKESSNKDLYYEMRNPGFELDSKIEYKKGSNAYTYKYGTYTEDYEEVLYSEGSASISNAKLILNEKTPILNKLFSEYETGFKNNYIKDEDILKVYANKNNLDYNTLDEDSIKDKHIKNIFSMRPEYIDSNEIEKVNKKIEKEIQDNFLPAIKNKNQLKM